MSWIIEDLVDISFFNDSSGIHDIDVVGYLGNDTQIMSNVYYGNVLFPLQFLDQFKYFCLNRNVQSCGWLIADQNVRVAGQSYGNDHTLSHAS